MIAGESIISTVPLRNRRVVSGSCKGTLDNCVNVGIVSCTRGLCRGGWHASFWFAWDVYAVDTTGGIDCGDETEGGEYEVCVRST